MGNSEKVVVLLILLVCAVVLGISLRPTDGLKASDRTEEAHEAEPAGERISGEGLALPEPDADRPARAIEIRDEPPRPVDALLTSLVEDAGDREVVLVRTGGLRETASPDFLQYTCRAGDTWIALADRFYGDRGRADLLREANEVVAAPAAGTELLVPVFDLIVEGLERERTEPREVPEFRVYEVVSGDSLISISKEMYGSGGRWMQIYDANRDILPDPDTLTVGTKIRIPQ